METVKLDHHVYLKIREILKLGPGEKRINPRQKRVNKRHDIYMMVNYRTPHMGKLGEGILCNLSQEGALFYTLNDLDLNDNVQLMIFPDESGQKPIQLTAEVVRREDSNDAYKSFNYGCKIKRIEDPDLNLQVSANNT